MLAGAAAAAAPATVYISPTGHDSRDGLTREHALHTFAKAFSLLAPGGTLVLLDGDYAEAAGTGSIDLKGPHDGQPPSGASDAQPTRIVAETPGGAVLREPLVLGARKHKIERVELRGLKVLAHASLYNTRRVTLKDMAFGAGLSIGTNDHDEGNTDDLVEDSWVWAAGERGIAVNYRAHRSVWRRVVVRGDGCGKPACHGDGNPNIGFTVYDSHDVSVQNVVVVDRVLLPGDAGYADFAAASHTGGLYTFGRNEWLGTLSLHGPDIGYYFEPDLGTVEAPTVRIVDAIAWDETSGGFNLARAGTGNVVERITASTRAGDGVRIAPELGAQGTLRQAKVSGSGRFAVNSAYAPQQVRVSGNWREGAFNQTRGSNSASEGGAHLQRYGIDGRHHGEPGFDAPSAAPLWPWPNEARLRADLCATTTRGLCAPSVASFSAYLQAALAEAAR